MKLSNIKIGKLNILDLAIILIIILFIGIFLITKNSASSNLSSNVENSGTTNSFIYTIKIEGLSETSTEMFKIGDDVYDKVSNVYIGKISNLEITNSIGLIDRNNGEIVEAEVPRKIDVKLSITTNGTINDGEYLANNLIRILVGNTKQIKTKYIMCTGTITSIEG